MAWVVVVIAGLFEVVWAAAMKQSEGFTRLWPSVVTLAAMVASFGLLSWSMRSLPLGTAYMVWTGIGAIGAFAFGIVALNEAMTPFRFIAAVLIAGGLVMMNVANG